MEENKIIEHNFLLNDILNEYNYKFVKRNRYINFYNLFFYMFVLQLITSINETHSYCNFNFCTKDSVKVIENTFVNRLVKLDVNYIFDVNHKFIDIHIVFANFKLDNFFIKSKYAYYVNYFISLI